MISTVANAVSWLFCAGLHLKNSKSSFYAALIATQVYLQINQVLHVSVLSVTKTSALLVVINRLPVHKLAAKSNILSSNAFLMILKSERLPVGPFRYTTAL